MQRQTKRVLLEDENSEDEWESEKDATQQNFKKAMQKNDSQNSDRMANIVYIMILKNVTFI